MKCLLCEFECKNNLGGDLTKHIKLAHDMELYQYVIKTEYNDIPPICKCGFCNELPVFYRGKFKQYALCHDTVEWFNSHYIEKYGIPLCKYCNNELKMNNIRKKLFMFCNGKCSGLYNKDTIIKKMKPKIINRYATDPTYKEKLSNVIKQRYENPEYVTAHKLRQIESANRPETKKKHSENSKKLWSNPEFKSRTSMLIKQATSTPEVRLHRSEIMLKLREDPIIREKYNNAFVKCSRISKLHMKWRTYLNLDAYGFNSEIPIDKYIVDELNDDLKIIIEVNGDHPHANPIKYKAMDLITMPHYTQYYAYEKWEKDKIRKETLESLGYIVFTIWEHDNIDVIKEQLMELILLRVYEYK